MSSIRFVLPGAMICTVLAGCVEIVMPPDETGDNTFVPAEFAFEADADPAVAALPFVQTELLVQPYPGADRQAVAQLYADAGGQLLEELGEIDLAVLQMPAGELRPVADRLLRSGLIETAQKNYVFTPDAAPSDPLYSRQDHLVQIRAAPAWDVTTGAGTAVIAIVDTGVHGGHEDLTGKITAGWNIYDGNANHADVNGHGTLVAGVAAAASNNGLGVTGVTWNCPLLPVRVGDAAGLSTARHVAAGILWAVGHGAKVINVSFAPLWSDRVVRSAAQTAFNRGCLVVISAGNAGGTTSAPGYDEALFVGAINAAGEIASFSDRGPFVDLVAPGTGIRTTRREGDYGMTNGTSFSAPIVSGVAALAWSIAPTLRPASIQKAILDTARDSGPPGKDDSYGLGAVDAAAAVLAAQRAERNPDATGPTLRIVKPGSGERLTGRYTVSMDANDPGGVADVALSIDGVVFAVDTRSPFQFVIDTSTFSLGAHTLAAVATDAYGNTSAERSVGLVFAPPLTSGTSSSAGTITFRSPAAGATVTGDVNISAGVSDRDGLALAEWLIDGKSVFVSMLTGTSSGVSYAWRAADSSPGRHTIMLMITDSAGTSTTATLTVTRR